MHNEFSKAKPTSVFGVDFRSLLEASWAMFFQYLDIPWLYEPATFLFNRQAYIPDFCISPTKDFREIYWIEIKPPDYGSVRESRHTEFGKLAVDRLDQNFCLVAGGPWEYWCYAPWSCFKPFHSIDPNRFATAAERSYGTDVQTYAETVAKCKRFLKQRGTLKYAQSLKDLEWYCDKMPSCYEAYVLRKRCRDHYLTLSTTYGPSPVAKVYATMRELGQLRNVLH